MTHCSAVPLFVPASATTARLAFVCPKVGPFATRATDFRVPIGWLDGTEPAANATTAVSTSFAMHTAFVATTPLLAVKRSVCHAYRAFTCQDAACKKACPLHAVLKATFFPDVCHVDVAVTACPDIPCSQYIYGWNGSVSVCFCVVYFNPLPQ